jgi:hypothetical protein
MSGAGDAGSAIPVACSPTLAGSLYRDSLSLLEEYRRAWATLDQALPRKDACKPMVALLSLAHDEACETELAGLIAAALKDGCLPDPVALRAQVTRRQRTLPEDLIVLLPPLASYDNLLEACQWTSRSMSTPCRACSPRSACPASSGTGASWPARAVCWCCRFGNTC